MIYHEPVLLQEVLHVLNVKKEKKYIDGTLGGGGHSIEIVRRGGVVLGIDLDKDAIDYVREKWKREHIRLGIKEENLIVTRGNFSNIGSIARSKRFGEVSGILLDLGVSSYHLDQVERGFSFQKDAPLDMRMDKRVGVTAADLVNALPKKKLYELFAKLGEERNAWSIVNSIIKSRRLKPIQTTGELVQIIADTYGIKEKNLFPKRRADISKRIFQALRLAVNNELENIEIALPSAVNLLEKKGKLLVISFHSLEDRIVKHMFEALEAQSKGIALTTKPIVPTKEEIDRNSRSRSSKLRVFEKL